MNRTTTKFILLLLLLTSFTGIVSAYAQVENKKEAHTLVVFFDAMRPDYITPEIMPNLYAFKQKATYSNKHRSVFPSVTRLNSTSYSTGSYPSTHGIMGNAIFFPEISTTKAQSTSDHNSLLNIERVTNGNLITSPSLAEVLAEAGKDMMVFSSGSTGQAMLQNHKLKGVGIINPKVIAPQSLKDKVVNEMGWPEDLESHNSGLHTWITDALLKYGLKEDGPDVSSIWYSDPDITSHKYGMGSKQALKALKDVDEQFGRIVAALEARGLTNSFNILITADHGFVTYVGNTTLRTYLIERGFKKSPNSDDVVVAGESIYVKNKDPELIEKIVKSLQREPWIGAIFTKAITPGDSKGWVEGTLSFDIAKWNHPRSGDILVDRNWISSVNSAGFAGAGFSKGVAGHGGLSPYEMSIPLIASGPSIKPQMISDFPTATVDIAPTVLALQNVSVPEIMDGRVMRELMLNQPKEDLKPQEEVISTKVKNKWGNYIIDLNITRYGKYNYINFSEVKRTKK